MSKLIKALPENRPHCEMCIKNTTPYSGLINLDGTRYYQRLCQGCYTQNKYGRRNALKKQWHKPGMEYKRHKKSFCERCNFIPEHSCQLDVDHIDGNHKNNLLENLQTLCASCHRIKTRVSKQDHSMEWRAA